MNDQMPPDDGLKLSQMFTGERNPGDSTTPEIGKKPILTPKQMWGFGSVGALLIGLVAWTHLSKPPAPKPIGSKPQASDAVASANGVTPEQLQGAAPEITHDTGLSALDKLNHLNDIQNQLAQAHGGQTQPGVAQGQGQNQQASNAQQQQQKQPPPPPKHTASATGPAGPHHILPADLRLRLDPEYEQWIQHQSSPAVAWQRADDPVRMATASKPGAIPGIDPTSQTLYQGGSVPIANKALYLPAGSEITAVTDMPINTDYPSVIRATITNPQELKGGKVIVTYSGPTLDRVEAKATSLVLNRNGTWIQQNIQGVIMTDLPLLAGNVDHHIIRQMIPVVVNAGLAGGGIALGANSSGSGVNTSDMIWSQMAQSGISQAQNEITQMTTGKPNTTITVPAGQEFQIMLTSGLEIK